MYVDVDVSVLGAVGGEQVGQEAAVACYRRPGWLAVHVINPLVRWLGSVSALHVQRRATGAIQRVPVNVVELGGSRYLVSVRGQAEWVRSLRAAGQCTVSRRGRRDRYRAVELAGDRREEVVAA